MQSCLNNNIINYSHTLDAARRPVQEEAVEDVALSPERYGELGAREEFILTISEFGYGKRSSSYEFRTSGRGGKGIRATDTNRLDKLGQLVAGFPVEREDQLLLVTDRGQVIRVPIDGIGMKGRSTGGVTIFRTADGERVVSVERIPDQGADEAGEAEEDLADVANDTATDTADSGDASGDDAPDAGETPDEGDPEA